MLKFFLTIRNHYLGDQIIEMGRASMTHKIKVTLSLHLINHHAINMCVKKWRHSSIHSQPQYKVKVNYQLHAPAILLQGKEPSICTG
jgi:hypothetical protein